jgi:hypothetical protein
MHVRSARIRPKRSSFQGASDTGRCDRRLTRSRRGRRPSSAARSRGRLWGRTYRAHYATRYPDDVAGVVLLDVTQDDPEEGAKLFPGAQAWRNAEHLDVVDAVRRVTRLAPLALGDTPLRVITAAEGASDAANPSYWLKLSSDAEQTTLAGGHDLAEENTEGLVAEIQRLLDTIEG